jgi:hypothetical protein
MQLWMQGPTCGFMMSTSLAMVAVALPLQGFLVLSLLCMWRRVSSLDFFLVTMTFLYKDFLFQHWETAWLFNPQKVHGLLCHKLCFTLSICS